jgi:membrane-bound serine protease (ClpP class)
MRRLTTSALIFLSVFGFLVTTAIAQSPSVAGPIVVADVQGPLDQRGLDFLTETVRTPGAQLVILQLNQPGIASGDPTELYEAIMSSETPIAAWVGPIGSSTQGGAAQILRFAHVTSAAPDVSIGKLQPVVCCENSSVPDGLRAIDPALDSTTIHVTEPIPNLVDTVDATIGEFMGRLDGATVETAKGPVLLETAELVEVDGSMVNVPTVAIQFVKPGLTSRFLRLATRPEATLFFLVIGLSSVAFEFYAAGVGITAGVASLALFLAGYGLAVLPMNWFAVGAVLAGLALYTADFQRSSLGLFTVAGTVLLFFGGTNWVRSDQFGPQWWAVLLTVLAALFFFAVALTTVGRSRFATVTIGREHLIGQVGEALSEFDPDGMIDLDGAKWRATATRAANIVPGEQLVVEAVTGVVLDVSPVNR